MSDECERGGGGGGGGGGGAEPRRDPSKKQEPRTVMWGTMHLAPPRCNLPYQESGSFTKVFLRAAVPMHFATACCEPA